jgi:hypothetical protein
MRLPPINHSVSLFIQRFINARRRIVQPMIDQSNRAGKEDFGFLVKQFISFPLPTATMGADYHDFTSHYPYHSIDPHRTPYGLQTCMQSLNSSHISIRFCLHVDMNGETARMSPYCLIPPVIPPNSYSSPAPIPDQYNASLSTRCEISSFSVRGPASLD